jgi:hypothetical protein
MNNAFYICDEYFLLIYETREILSSIRRPEPPVVREMDHVKYWIDRFKPTKTKFSYPKEPIFLIERYKRGHGCEHWKIIVGENIGWTVIFDFMNVKPLEMEKNV